MAKWRLDRAPEATVDGTGHVALDIYGITDDGDVIPGRHQTVMVPESGLEAALALPTNTQKVAAIKDLIGESLPSGWENDDLEDMIDANAEAAAQAQAMADFIADRGWTYPLPFTL